MEIYDYLILGGGMTAHAAIKGIRELDADSTIGMITEEAYPPYRRPWLSKGLWKGKLLDEIWYDTHRFVVHFHQSCRITILDAKNHQVRDANGQVYQYKKLLIATGGSPRRLNFDAPEIIYFRSLEDYQRLLSQSEKGKRIAVIGGGFIGSEIAASLSKHNNRVMLIFPEDGINGRILPIGLSLFLNQYYEKHGVEVLSRHGVTRVEGRGDDYVIGFSEVTKTTESLRQVDVIVAGLGIMPNDSLAQSAGIKISNGIDVDEFLVTSDVDIYAAGDVANFFLPALGKRVRIEHEDNALQMGRCAGRNMAGDSTAYRHLSYFYSDLFDLGYEAVGELDPSLELYEDWIVPHCKGVIYYIRKSRVCGVLLWNVWDQVATARKLVESGQPISRSALNGLIS